jgi:predicted Rossmann fold nucleotide-binding protein DprA/Smf involved in DNA uptake
VHIDDIATRTGLTAGETGSTLLNMEISGLIKDVGGRRFVRL